MLIGPRVRVRVSPRCDDECCSAWRHPLTVAAMTVACQVVGEVLVRRLTRDDTAAEPEAAPPKKRRS